MRRSYRGHPLPRARSRPASVDQNKVFRLVRVAFGGISISFAQLRDQPCFFEPELIGWADGENLPRGKKDVNRQNAIWQKISPCGKRGDAQEK